MNINALATVSAHNKEITNRLQKLTDSLFNSRKYVTEVADRI